jgi:thioredoxin reductase/Fe-S-cluster-containing hydrogenase component 2
MVWKSGLRGVEGRMQHKQVVVVGCGPAGLASAIEAAQAGAKVTIVDENARPGGQLFKQIHKFFGSQEHYAGVRGFNIGTEMLRKARELDIEVMLNSVVYGIFENNTLGVVTNGKNLAVQAEKIVLATGASENALLFPGWTLPGIMGAGAAQTMVNLHRVLPGKRCVMIGSGNVGLIVSYQLVEAGAEVVAIVEADSRVGGYDVHATKIRRAGVPILLSHTIKEARGKEAVEEVMLVKLDEKWQNIPGTEQILTADFVCLAVGLSPLTELAWMVNCQCKYVSELGGHVIAHDENMETTVSGIYAAGDCTGVEEASIAMEQGRLTGISIAESLGFMSRTKAEGKKAQVRARMKELRGKPVFYESSADEGKYAEVCREPAAKQEGERVSLTKKSKGFPEYPSEERFQKGPVAVIECRQEIPCDPCAFICPQGAVSVGKPITKLPQLDDEKCAGCGLCIPGCPGLAIFVIDKTYSKNEALVQLPHEMSLLPKTDEMVDCLNRGGERVTEGKVVKILNPKRYDCTPVVSVVVNKKYADEVRAIALRRDEHGRG